MLYLFVYLFIRSVTHVTLDTSITDYNLYILQHNLQYMDIYPVQYMDITQYNIWTSTQYNIWTSTQYNIINKNTKFKDQLEVVSVTTNSSVRIYIFIPTS